MVSGCSLLYRTCILQFQNLSEPCQFCFFLFWYLFRQICLLCISNGLRYHIHWYDAFPMYESGFRKVLPEGPNQRIMQRLIHVGLGHSDIVLESSRHRFIHGMDDTQHFVTSQTESTIARTAKQVINLIQCFLLVDHLFINTENIYYIDLPLVPLLSSFTNFFDNVHIAIVSRSIHSSIFAARSK